MLRDFSTSRAIPMSNFPSAREEESRKIIHGKQKEERQFRVNLNRIIDRHGTHNASRYMTGYIISTKAIFRMFVLARDENEGFLKKK